MSTNDNKLILYQFLNKRLKSNLSVDKFSSYYKTFNTDPSNQEIRNLDDYNSKFLNFVLYSEEKSNGSKSYESKNNIPPNQNKRKLVNQNIKNQGLFETTNNGEILNPYFQPQMPKSAAGAHSLLETTENFNNFDNVPDIIYSKNTFGNNTPDTANENVFNQELKMHREHILSPECEPNKKFISNDKNPSIFQEQFSLPEKIDFNNSLSACNVCEQSFYAICNSRDREVTKFPFHDYFQIHFSQPIKNIIEIKCQHIILPNLNYFEFEPFLFLQIPEIDQLFVGSQNFYSNMFAKILPICASPAQRFITCFPAKTKKKFNNQPVASISRLSFKLCSSNGNPLPLPTDVFQIIKIENTIWDNSSVYKITMINQPRNQNECFFSWLKSACHIFDPIYITGIPEIRQQLHYLHFEKYDSFECSNIVLYASPLKITNQLFSDINFTLLTSPTQNCFCSFNKMTVTILLKFKILDINNNLIHSQIVK